MKRISLDKEIYSELWDLVSKHGDEVKHHSTIINVWWQKMLCMGTSTEVMITSTCHNHYITIRHGLAHHIQIRYDFGEDAAIMGNLSNNTHFVKKLIEEIKDYFDPDKEKKSSILDNFGSYSKGGY